jgi:hypothetical protein
VFEKLFGYIAEPTIAAPGADVPKDGSSETARRCARFLQCKRSLLAYSVLISLAGKLIRSSLIIQSHDYLQPVLITTSPNLSAGLP